MIAASVPSRSQVALKRDGIRRVDILYRIPAHPDIGGLLILQKRFDQLPGLVPVAGQVDAHIGDRRHGGNILRRMMAHAQGPIADAPGNAD